MLLKTKLNEIDIEGKKCIYVFILLNYGNFAAVELV